MGKEEQKSSQPPTYLGVKDTTLDSVQKEAARLLTFADLFNPHTEAVLKEVGLNLTGKKVVIMGMGPGTEISIYQKMDAAEIIGVDQNPQMLEVARRQFSPNGNVRLIGDDVANLEKYIDPSSVDLIAARVLWQHIHPNKQSSIMEHCVQVLKPGGACLFEDFFNIDPTWQLEPTCPAFQNLRAKFGLMYKRTEMPEDMASCLEALCKNAGLKIRQPDTQRPWEYSVSSEGHPEFKGSHIQLLQRVGQGMIQMGIISTEEFQSDMSQFTAHLAKEHVIIWTPKMKQVFAVKE
ncbi:MAG: class I SAM-dependent methyltransferase [Candidatus Gottesmanbacteria bacterium]